MRIRDYFFAASLALVVRKAMCNSANWASVTGLGVSEHEIGPGSGFGKAMTSRILVVSAKERHHAVNAQGNATVAAARRIERLPASGQIGFASLL
jgi:hypothetical protein